MSPTYAAASPPASPVRAELVGSNECRAEGFTARGHAPTLMLCRLLIEAGIAPELPLIAYRGDTICLTIGSIGEAARLEVNSKGTGFIKYRPAVRTAPSIAPHEVARVNSIPDAAIGGARPKDQRTRQTAAPITPARRRARERRRSESLAAELGPDEQAVLAEGIAGIIKPPAIGKVGARP